MNLKQKIFILFLLVAFTNNIAAKVRWKQLKTPGKVEQIIGGDALNNFWIEDNHHTLIHFRNGKWISYPVKDLFPIKDIRQYHPLLVEKNRIVVLLTDLKWKSHLAEIRNGKIIRYDYVTNVPLYRVVFVAGTLYAMGDFGLIIKLEGRRWKKIPSPIKAHIYSATGGPKGNLWIGTNGEGVFSWNGKTFSRYKKPSEIINTSIEEIKFFRDTLYIRTSNKSYYKFYQNIFHPVPFEESPFPETSGIISHGYYKIFSTDKKKYLIPYYFKIKSFTELRDGHALYTTASGQLFYNQEVDHNFFLDFTSLFGLEGPKYSFPGINLGPGDMRNSMYTNLHPGIIFSDFNRDQKTDILLFNIFDKRRPYLFLNNQDNYFTNFTNLLGLNRLPFNGSFSYAFDLNGDRIPEIITPDFKSGNNTLKIYTLSAGHYETLYTCSIPQQYTIKPLQSLSVTDVDNDGDLDLALVFGYQHLGKGSIYYLKNNGYGKFNTADSSQVQLFKGWNVQAIYADFNNDGMDDVYVVRNWGPDIIFSRKKESGWNKHPLDSIIPDDYQRKLRALAFDFDNDGDLDVFSIAQKPFISVFQNDGHGNFKNITAKTGLDTLNTGELSGQITAGDFDNNGYIDLFIVINSKNRSLNYMFLNDSARNFVDKSKEMGINQGNLKFAAAGDIDNDGDIDLYGYREGNNILWLNNLDSNNYIRIKPVGVKSNSEGLGSKIWIYEAGHLNNPRYLAGYRQTGSFLTSSSYQNELTAHFGVNANKHYDIKIQFPEGTTRILQNVMPGKTIRVEEISAPLSWFYTRDKEIYILLRNKVFISYLLVILAGLSVLMWAIYYGTRNFRWDVRLTSIIILLNLILFSILLVTLYSSGNRIRYFLPLVVLVLGSFGPVGFFLWIKKFSNLKSQKEKRYELFQSLLNFSHGAWASSNLNSLQLFFENLSVDDLNDSAYSTAFQKRKETFMTLTLPVIEEIVTLSREQADNKDLAMDIEQNTGFLVRILKSDLSQADFTEKEKLTTAITKLRELLSKLKNRVFAGHSCVPSKIIDDIQTELHPLMAEKQVNLKIINRLPEVYPALMDATKLADILDNCVQNSVKAMTDTKDKQLIIKLIKGDPRIFIEITDNGCGIPQEKQEQIFENGYSTTNSTGYGLFYARETLSKYGGRIYVKNSIPYQKTTLVIELQKGSNK